MTAAPRVTLGGVPLSLRPGEFHSWSLRSGVKPVEQTFIVTRERAEKIFKRAQTQFTSVGEAQATVTTKTQDDTGPLTLRAVAPGFKPLVVKGLYAVSTEAVDENRLGVVVVDRRWTWGREHVLRDYNLRRFAGDYRLVGNELTPIQVAQTAPDFIYRRVTLNNGLPWTAKQALEDILMQLVGKSDFRMGTLKLMRDIHDMEIDDSGTSAMQRLLGYIPGANIFVDLDGKIVVYNELDGGEDGMLKKAGRPIRGPRGDGKTVELDDNSLIRPKNVISLFTVEPEIRFDFTEEQTFTVTRGREPRLLQNVLPVTDATLLVNGKVVARNTWLPIDDWLTAVAGLADFPGGVNGRPVPKSLGAINQALIRKHYLSGFEHLRNRYVLSQLGVPDPRWGRRIDAVELYWRSAFRLLPQWRDKVSSIRAIRAAIVDQENGTRGKAEAFFDYTIRPSKRTLAKVASDPNAKAAWTVPGYADDLLTANPGPADVVTLEPESGTFQLAYKVDPWGDGVKIAPGTILDETPLQSVGAGNLVWNSTKVELAPRWRMSVVLTVLLASPNNQTRLHAESVSIADALKLIPGKRKSRSAKGPDWKVRVGPGIQTARFAWLDSFAAQVEEAVFTDKPMPRQLLINREHLDSIAKANAARVQALLVDRHQGERVVSLNPDIKPAGSLSQVTHIITLDSVITHLSLPPMTLPPDLFALLPDSTRKLLQRGVQE